MDIPQKNTANPYEVFNHLKKSLNPYKGPLKRYFRIFYNFPGISQFFAVFVRCNQKAKSIFGASVNPEHVILRGSQNYRSNATDKTSLK